MFNNPLGRLAIPLQRNCPLFPLSRHQSRQRRRQLAWVGPNEFVRPDRDGLWPLGVVTQGEAGFAEDSGFFGDATADDASHPSFYPNPLSRKKAGEHWGAVRSRRASVKRFGNSLSISGLVVHMVWDSVKLVCLGRQRNFMAEPFRLHNEGAMVFRQLLVGIQ